MVGKICKTATIPEVNLYLSGCYWSAIVLGPVDNGRAKLARFTSYTGLFTGDNCVPEGFCEELMIEFQGGSVEKAGSLWSRGPATEGTFWQEKRAWWARVERI